MKEYDAIIAQMSLSGASNREMQKKIGEIVPGLSESAMRHRLDACLSRLRKKGIIPYRKIGMNARYESSQNRTVSKKNTIYELLEAGTTIDDLSCALGVSGNACEVAVGDIKKQGYNVHEANGVIKIEKIVVPSINHYESKWDGNKTIRFALIGDTQINSKYAQLTHLHKFYEICKQEGIETVYHTGDIDEGEQMRVGHQYECYTQGADDHVKEIVRVYPKIDGITTHFITGNHDASIIKRCGYDIGYAIEQKREDMVYLGQSSAVIELTPNCTLELRHPIDGTSYALSYKMQKMIDAMSGGEKPNILAVGHYHKSEYLFYRNVSAFQTGSFQAQTPFMKGKGIAAAVGGWIVEVSVCEDGSIGRIKQEYIPFYKSIPDDWENWR